MFHIQSFVLFLNFTKSVAGDDMRRHRLTVSVDAAHVPAVVRAVLKLHSSNTNQDQADITHSQQKP